MQNSRHEIRHINSRKILTVQCQGMIKEFARRLGKKEQQCSNFLRENKPVNIGDSIARQIESTFGYPEGWLDHEVTGSESITDSDNFQTVTLFAELNKIIERIGASVYNSRSEVATLITYSNTVNAIHKLNRVSLSVRTDMQNTAMEYVAGIVTDKMGLDVNVDNHAEGLVCGDCFFSLSRLFNAQSAKLHEMYIFRTYPYVKRLYQYTPTIIDGEYHVFIIRSLDATGTDKYQGQGEQAAALKKLKSVSDVNIQRGSIPPILIDCIDDNPDFNSNNS